MFQYYALDWVAMGFTFVSVYWIGECRRAGFILGMVSNVFWFGFGILADSPAAIITNVILLLLNARGYLKWQAR